MCLVGSGDGHVRARGVLARSEDGKERESGDGGGGLGSLKCARDDYSYVNTCALFFMKRGFPYVSVLEGVSFSFELSFFGGGLVLPGEMCEANFSCVS